MSQQLMLNGTGILLNSSSCYVHAENFRLLPHSVGRSTVNLAEARIVLPSIDKILNSLEEDLFQADTHHPEVDLQHLDGLVERASSESQMQGLDISKMVTTLHSRTVNRPTPHWVWIIIVIVTSMACGAIWPIWVKLFNKCCPRIRKCVTRILQPPPTSNDVELHDWNRVTGEPGKRDIGRADKYNGWGIRAIAGVRPARGVEGGAINTSNDPSDILHTFHRYDPVR